MNKRLQGYSLVELAVTLVVTGIIGLAVWRLLPLTRPVAVGDPAIRILRESEQAVLGFAMRSHRLPCPDVDGDGLEDCDAANVQGELPLRSLGLATPVRLRYGVYRAASVSAVVDADLATAQQRYTPVLPPVASVTVLNGLDICLALRTAAAAPSGLTVGGVPAAFAVAHPGELDADGDGNSYDGLNTTGFALPGTAQSAVYDDRVIAVGLGELATRLGCVQHLAEANGALRGAWSAYDLDRFALAYQKFRAFAWEVRKTNTIIAGVNLSLAMATLASTIGAQFTMLEVLAELPDPITLATYAGAVATVSFSGVAVVAQAALVATAVLKENTAKEQKDKADAFKLRTAGEFATAYSRAQTVDQKGLLP